MGFVYPANSVYYAENNIAIPCLLPNIISVTQHKIHFHEFDILKFFFQSIFSHVLKSESSKWQISNLIDQTNSLYKLAS